MASNIDRDLEKTLYLNVAASSPATPLSGDPVRYLGYTGIALINEGADVASQTSVFIGRYWARHNVHAANGAVAVGDALYFSDTATGATLTQISNAPSGLFYGIARGVVTSTEVAEILVDHPESAGVIGGLGGGYRTLANDAAVVISPNDGVIILQNTTTGNKAATMTATYANHVIDVRLVAATGNSYTFAVTGGNVTFNAANEAARLVYSGAAWELVSLSGATLV
jgi:hypothetical protein